jgi:hypothetical protein
MGVEGFTIRMENFLKINQPNKNGHPYKNNKNPIDDSNNFILGCLHLFKELRNKPNKSGN